MSNLKNETSAVETTPVVKTPSQTESIYTVEELVAGFKAFNTSREIVSAALRKAKKKTATFAEAKSIVDKFRTKEVK